MLINIFFSASSFRSAINVPSFAIDIFPVSSDTTTTIASDSLLIPNAALCLVPSSLAISSSDANGNIQAAADILLSLITTAPSCNGVLGVNIFTNICGDISEFNATPVAIISFNFISLSITIKAPIFFLDNSVAASTTLYISSFVLDIISLSKPKYFVILFDAPNCSNALLNSG